MKSAWAREIPGNRKVVSSKALAGSIIMSSLKKLGTSKPKDKPLSTDERSNEDVDQKVLKHCYSCQRSIYQTCHQNHEMTGQRLHAYLGHQDVMEICIF